MVYASAHHNPQPGHHNRVVPKRAVLPAAQHLGPLLLPRVRCVSGLPPPFLEPVQRASLRVPATPTTAPHGCALLYYPSAACFGVKPWQALAGPGRMTPGRRRPASMRVARRVYFVLFHVWRQQTASQLPGLLTFRPWIASIYIVLPLSMGMLFVAPWCLSRLNTLYTFDKAPVSPYVYATLLLFSAATSTN